MSGRRTPAARSPTPRSSDDFARLMWRARLAPRRAFSYAAAIGTHPSQSLPGEPTGGWRNCLSSADILQHRKRLDQPAVELREHTGEKADAGEHEQAAHYPLDMSKVRAKAREESGKRLDRKRGDDERQAEPKRVDGKQARALGDRGLRCRDGEDCRQDRPDARRPAEREGEPHHIRTPQPDWLCNVNARLPVQESDRREAEEVQPHDDDGDAGNDCEFVRIKPHQRAHHAGTGAERHEHRGETGHEQERRDDGIAFHQRWRFRLRQPLERGPRQIDEIGRYQRQHARRQKAHEAGKEGGKDGDVGGHAPKCGAFASLRKPSIPVSLGCDGAVIWSRKLAAVTVERCKPSRSASEAQWRSAISSPTSPAFWSDTPTTRVSPPA